MAWVVVEEGDPREMIANPKEPRDARKFLSMVPSGLQQPRAGSDCSSVARTASPRFFAPRPPSG
jgi:hypothetical protein